MLKNKFKFLTVVLLALMLVTTLSFATNETINAEQAIPNDTTTGEDVSQNAVENANANATQETHKSDYYKTGNDITVTELIDGNAFIVGNNVTIKGQIGGDLFVIASNSLKIDGGAIYGNVFVLSPNITVNGTIYDLYAVSENITIEYNGVVYRDLRVVTDNFEFSGIVNRNTFITAGTVNITKDAYVGGNFNYSSSTEGNIASEAQIIGETNFTKTVTDGSSATMLGIIIGYILKLIKMLIFTLIIWLAFLLLAPKFGEKATTTLKQRPVMSLLVGLATLVVIPVIFILLLMIPVVTIELAFVLIVIYALLLAISSVVAITAIANFVKDRFKIFKNAKDVWYVIMVAIVLWVIQLIPIVGVIVSALVVLLGLGILVLNIFRINTKVKKEKADKKAVDTGKENKAE